MQHGKNHKASKLGDWDRTSRLNVKFIDPYKIQDGWANVRVSVTTSAVD